MSGLGFRIFMFAMMYCVLPIMYVMQRNEVKPKKNIILGVTIPRERWEAPQVLAVTQWYQKWLAILFWGFTVLALVPLVFRHMSVVLAYYLTWMLFAIGAFMGMSALAWKRLRKVKLERGWGREGGRLMVDVKAAASRSRWVSGWWFLPAVLLSLVPAAGVLLGSAEKEAIPGQLGTYLIMAAVVALFYGIYRMIDGQRAEIVDDNTELSLLLTRIRRESWGRNALWCAYLTAAFNVVMWLLADWETGIILACLVYMAVLLAVVCQVEFHIRKAQSELTAKLGGENYVDEDDHWLYGMFYFNPNDAHLLKNNRIGTNMTFNMAKPAGKVIMFSTVVLLLAMPFFGIWLVKEEMTPVSLEISKDQLVASQVGRVYTVPLADIETAELLEELPPCRKQSGTNFDTLYKGAFQVDGLGTCRLCLNPLDPCFLVVRTAEETYIFSVKEEPVLQAIYGTIQS